MSETEILCRKNNIYSFVQQLSVTQKNNNETLPSDNGFIDSMRRLHLITFLEKDFGIGRR